MLVDFQGNDTYRGVYYAQGAAAHFALGTLVDQAGNDQYNDRSALGQVLGAGRDGSIGALLDRGETTSITFPRSRRAEGT